MGPRAVSHQAQFEASAEAQKRVAAARKIAGADLAEEFENTCSATGPQRVALAREAAGLPPLKDYTVEPTKSSTTCGTSALRRRAPSSSRRAKA